MNNLKHETLSLDKFKGRIPFPCCPQKSAIVSMDAHGKISVQCPNCGKFVLMDQDLMTATITKPCRGASEHFKNAG